MISKVSSMEILKYPQLAFARTPKIHTSSLLFAKDMLSSFARTKMDRGLSSRDLRLGT
jgi:hypothetical protein